MTKTTEPASTTDQNQTLQAQLLTSVLILSEGKPCRFLIRPSVQSGETDIIPTLQIRKLRPRKMKLADKGQ